MRLLLPTVSTQSVNELTLLTVADTLSSNFNIHSVGNTGYTLISPPAGMTISAAGVVNWTPTQIQSPSTNLITVVVTNSNPYDLIQPSLTATNMFTVVVKEVNVPATLPVISTQIVNELTLLMVTNSATNANIHWAVSGYTLVTPPNNMVVNASGIISWTPLQARKSRHQSDHHGGHEQQSLRPDQSTPDHDQYVHGHRQGSEPGANPCQRSRPRRSPCCNCSM